MELLMPQTDDNSIASVQTPDPSKNASRGAVAGAAVIRSLSLGLLMAGSAAGALAAGETLAVREEVQLASPPSKTWSVIKDFQNWQAWHPAFVSTKITKGAANAKGTVRVLTAKDGAVFTEELVSHDDASRSYQYRIIKSPLPISGYVSTLVVEPYQNGSRVIWSSTFTANADTSGDEMKRVIAGVYRTGLDNLRSTVE
jgi:hypothetical protein